jgi:hypothetical protein
MLSGGEWVAVVDVVWSLYPLDNDRGVQPHAFDDVMAIRSGAWSRTVEILWRLVTIRVACAQGMMFQTARVCIPKARGEVDALTSLSTGRMIAGSGGDLEFSSHRRGRREMQLRNLAGSHLNKINCIVGGGGRVATAPRDKAAAVFDGYAYERLVVQHVHAHDVENDAMSTRFFSSARSRTGSAFLAQDPSVRMSSWTLRLSRIQVDVILLLWRISNSLAGQQC